MLPLFLDLADRLVLVVGGGPVGRRRAAAVRAAGGRVRLVCLEARPADEADAAVHWLTEPYRPGHLDGVSLAVAAGPPQVNALVLADARARGIWTATAAGPHGDALLPAVVRRGGLTLAVGTGGASPALANLVRRRLEAEFDDAFAVWVGLLAEARRLARQRIADAGRRRALLARLADWSWLERLRREGADAVREALRAAVDAG
jgi:precorrin-2 dehydrogenase/sirohydrochlorin ferrochelatase